MSRTRTALVLVIALLTTQRVARAEAPDLASPRSPRERIDQARGLRKVGSLLTAFGLVLGAGSLALGVLAASNHSCSPQPHEDCGIGTLVERFGAGVFGGIGAAMLAAGIPLWAVGSWRLARLERAGALIIAPTAGGGHGGVTAAYSLRF